jgi:hypothetical protein
MLHFYPMSFHDFGNVKVGVAEPWGCRGKRNDKRAFNSAREGVAVQVGANIQLVSITAPVLTHHSHNASVMYVDMHC